MITREKNPVGWALFLYELIDAHEHLGKLVNRISEDPEYSEEALRVELGHIYAHLNRAWFRRGVEGELPDSERELASKYPGDLDPVA